MQLGEAVPSAQATAARRGLRIPGVILIGHSPTGSVYAPGVHLVFDHRGVGVASNAIDLPRVLPWDSLHGYHVDPWQGDNGASGNALLAPSGALVVIETKQGAYRFIVPGAQAAALGQQIGNLASTYRERRQAAADEEPAAQRTRASAYERWQPVLVVILVIVVATAVALILAQSAGAIHISFLGSDTASTIPPLAWTRQTAEALR